MLRGERPRAATAEMSNEDKAWTQETKGTAGPVLCHRLRRWPRSEPMFRQHSVSLKQRLPLHGVHIAGKRSSASQNGTASQRWHNVGPAPTVLRQHCASAGPHPVLVVMSGDVCHFDDSLTAVDVNGIMQTLSPRLMAVHLDGQRSTNQSLNHAKANSGNWSL